MRALVTGGAGFIGSHIVDTLISRGDDVICIDDESAPQNENFYRNKAAQNITGDIRDESLRTLYQDVDVVFHLAARSRIQPTVGNPSECFSVNVLGTQEVLEACRISGVKRVVYSSSSSYYGNRNLLPFKEDMLPGCATPYSLSKWQGEQICELYNRLYGLSTVSLRYFNVYGPREPLQGQYAPVIGLFKRQFREGKPMTIIGTGQQRRDFTHISDVVEANLLAADKMDAVGIINIGTGKNYSVIEVAKLIGGENPHIQYASERVGETKETLANITRAKEDLGWLPKVSLDSIINSY